VVDWKDLIDQLKDDRNRMLRYIILGGVVVVSVLFAVLVWYSLPGRRERNPVPVELPTEFALRSAAFRDRGLMPEAYTIDGRNYSPPLDFLNVPPGTVELALTMHEDMGEEAPPRAHWVFYQLPPDTGAIPEAIALGERPSTPMGALQGTNHWGEVGYRGPMPDPGAGASRYIFTLYALSEPLGEETEPALTRDELLTAMSGKVIAEATFIGRYKR
jgi:Raf kinase inhibitor-like YbhB/YbcL family protein